MRCPSCGHEQRNAVECELCGIVFAKWHAPGVVERRSQVSSAFDRATATPVERLLGDTNTLVVDQDPKQWWEILLNWEQASQYAVSDSVGRGRGYVVEQGRGFLAALSRIFLLSHRPLDIKVFSPEFDVVLQLRRPFHWFFSEMNVVTQAGEHLGRVERRFSALRRVYELKDSSGRTFGRIVSPIFRIWTFPVVDEGGVERGKITKQWSGFAQEMLTDADKFRVEFDPQWSIAQRAVVFSAAVTIDYDFFEHNNRRN